MPRTLRLILGDQLSTDIATLRDADPRNDIVLMAELSDEATYVKHHKKKIAFLFSAMRHFAADLEKRGYAVHYRKLDEANGPQSFTQALIDAVNEFAPDRIVVTEAGEWRVQQMIEGWVEMFDCAVELRADDRFLCTHEEFRDWAEGSKTLRMEYFYRTMRRKHAIMMEDGEPAGGQWNYDKDNREPLDGQVEIPDRPDWTVDAVTREVIDLVEGRFSDHFGTLDNFAYPVTRRQATHYLNWFIEEALPCFGRYQDAMKQGRPLIFHSHLSALINCGLLSPMEAVEKAEQAWWAGHVPINAAEGFIRQIIGWREFIRGVYWSQMPGYGRSNKLLAQRPLPDFFWTGDAKMNCMKQSIAETRDNAYAHHIQRLMVIGNFCLLAGLDPKEVQEWYLIVYHDAYEWVEMPNVVGMILFADGGLFASKPYAASGSYINKMSDYCVHCDYAVKRRHGPGACPFNYLYWDFLDRNRDRLKDNPRIGMMYKTLDRFDDEKIETIREDAKRFLDAL